MRKLANLITLIFLFTVKSMLLFLLHMSPMDIFLCNGSINTNHRFLGLWLCTKPTDIYCACDTKHRR